MLAGLRRACGEVLSFEIPLRCHRLALRGGPCGMLADDAAFKDWVQHTQAGSLRFARRMLGQDADAADLVQESYVRAYIALRRGQFRGDASRLDPWLRRILLRACLDALRTRRRRREEVVADFDEAPAPSTASATVDRQDLERALRDLPAEQRTAFVLREIEGYSLRETAEELSCSVGAVEQRVLRAWAGLRRRLHREAGE